MSNILMLLARAQLVCQRKLILVSDAGELSQKVMGTAQKTAVYKRKETGHTTIQLTINCTSVLVHEYIWV